MRANFCRSSSREFWLRRTLARRPDRDHATAREPIAWLAYATTFSQSLMTLEDRFETERSAAWWFINSESWRWVVADALAGASHYLHISDPWFSLELPADTPEKRTFPTLPGGQRFDPNAAYDDLFGDADESETIPEILEFDPDTGPLPRPTPAAMRLIAVTLQAGRSAGSRADAPTPDAVLSTLTGENYLAPILAELAVQHDADPDRAARDADLALRTLWARITSTDTAMDWPATIVSELWLAWRRGTQRHRDADDEG